MTVRRQLDLYIVRHGNTFGPDDRVRRIGARTDLPLVDSGKRQAMALAKSFSPVAFVAAFSAPLKRTDETARLILAAQESPPPLIHTDALTELDYGPDEGQPEAAVLARLGASALHRWEQDDVPPAGWLADPAALIARWQKLAAQLFGAAGETRNTGPVLIVTSNGIARFALKAFGDSQKSGQSASSQTRSPDGIPRRAGKLRTGAFGVLRLSHGPTGNPTATVISWDERPEEPR